MIWLYQGDCLEVMRGWPDASIDAVVTDPPYGIRFMGKAWDGADIDKRFSQGGRVHQNTESRAMAAGSYDFSMSSMRAFQDFSVAWAREALRLLKPGGHLLAFSSPRTYHRMACGVEDAGFEIRDSLHWFYGSGFPKSLDVGEGRGTAIKPGHEPIVLARKPLDGTVAGNVLKYGTGALNIDACRLTAFDDQTTGRKNSGSTGKDTAPAPLGRWPANVLLDDDAAAELDAQSGILKSGSKLPHHVRVTSKTKNAYSERKALPEFFPGDTGGAARFFYVAKTSRRERDWGCEALPPREGGEATGRQEGSAGLKSPRAGAGRGGGVRNFHPTVKPVTLMRYLARLITPPGGVVLDPFLGSGSTGLACLEEGLRFVGIEVDGSYFEIARSRLGALAASTTA